MARPSVLNSSDKELELIESSELTLDLSKVKVNYDKFADDGFIGALKEYYIPGVLKVGKVKKTFTLIYETFTRGPETVIYVEDKSNGKSDELLVIYKRLNKVQAIKHAKENNSEIKEVIFDELFSKEELYNLVHGI